MTPREKKLALAVGLIIGLIINYLLIEFAIGQHRQLQRDLESKTRDLKIKELFAGEKALWEKRSGWVQAHQIKLTNPSGAGVALLDAVKEVAKRNNVTIESPNLGNLEKRPYCTAIAVGFETKSNWENLCGFLREIQGPDQLLVFEKAQIQVDVSDKTQMRGKLRLSKWYAPN